LALAWVKVIAQDPASACQSDSRSDLIWLFPFSATAIHRLHKDLSTCHRGRYLHP
jgi:hypothetical protein